MSLSAYFSQLLLLLLLYPTQASVTLDGEQNMLDAIMQMADTFEDERILLGKIAAAASGCVYHCLIELAFSPTNTNEQIEKNMHTLE